jgi:hypothetical protein
MRSNHWSKIWLLAIALTSFAQNAHAQPQNPPPKKILAVEAAQKLGGPTLISLHFNQTTALTVVESLARQAGLAVDPAAVEVLQNQPIASLNIDRQPFWPVMQSLASRLKINLGLNPQPNFASSQRGLAIGLANDSIQGPAEMCGPFMLVVTSTGRSIPLAADRTPASGQRVTIEFVLLADPKLHARGRPNGQQLELITDLGGPLQIQRPADYWATDLKEPWPLCWRFKAIAELAESGVRSINNVRGQLTGILAPLSWQPWEISEVLNGKELSQSTSGATFSFRGLTKASGFAPYHLALSSGGRGETADAGWPPRSDLDRIASLQLLDAQGHRFVPQSWRFENGNFLVAFTAATGAAATQGEPAKLIWSLPTEIAEIQIPFEFPGLPLP